MIKKNLVSNFSYLSNAAGQTNNYCDGYLNVKTIKPCPNPESFDIQSEISKPITSVKLDFNVVFSLIKSLSS